MSDNVFHDALCRIICPLATSVVNSKFTHRSPIDQSGGNFKTVCRGGFKFAVADPGFPRGGGANFPGGRQHTILPKFPKKLHEIERIWTPRGGARPLRPPLDPPLVCNVIDDSFTKKESYRLPGITYGFNDWMSIGLWGTTGTRGYSVISHGGHTSLADVHSKILDAPLPPDSNSFNLMQFLRKFSKIVCWHLAPLNPPPQSTGRFDVPTSGKSWVRHRTWL